MARRRKLRHVMRPLRRLAWPLQALVLAAFWALSRTLPRARASAFGRRLLRALGPRLSWHEQLRANLAIAHSQASRDELEALTRGAWGNFGATLAEYPHLAEIAGPDFHRHVELVVDPEVRRWIDSGRPLVFITGHLGNWELAAAAAAVAAGPLTAIYARQANPLIDRMVQRMRRPLGCGFVANDAGARPLLAELLAGRSLGVVADLRVDSGAPLPFFGEAAPTTLVPARLALKFGCPLVPTLVERLTAARFRVTACPPLRSRDTSADAAQQARDMMQQFNELLETWIAARPAAWQCLKRRWSKDVVRRRLATVATVGTGRRRASAIAGSSG
jgi:Kdo2-lipid IVA lauroyltransferase/acyltransferase